MSDTEISEIERLVSVIGSEEVRKQTRLNLFTKLVYEKKGDVKLPEQYVDEVITECQRRFDELDGCYEEDFQSDLLAYAARIAKNVGRKVQAQKLYEKAINFADEKEQNLFAARLAQEAEMESKTKELYGKVFSFYEQKGDFAGAARIADEAKMSEKADAYRVLQKKLRIPHQ